MSVIIQHKRGTALQWTTLNPTLEAGEVGWESDTNKFKIGTGSTVWTSLPYATLTPTELSSTYARLVGGNAFTDAQTITSTAIGQVPLSIIPFTGQTASTFRVRNSANSADLMSIDSSGQIRTTTILNPNSFNNSRLLMQDTGVLIDTGITTNVPLAVRGSNGQTTDLQRWQSWNGSTASTVARIDALGKIIIPGGTTVYDYAVETPGSTDTAWKKLIEVNCATGLFTGASYEIEVVDSFDNYGIIDRVPLRFRFYVKVTRSGGVQDDVLAASVTGPSVNYVRVVKTSNALYEIQVRQPDIFRIISFKARRVGQNNTSESYNPSGRTYGTLDAGSTTGTIYVPVNDSTTSANFLVDNFSQVSANRMTIQPLGTLAATTPLLMLTGTATQNSNYAEFRNSGGTILSHISNDGSWNQGLDSTRTFVSAASGRIQVVSSNSTAPGILLRPFAANYAGYDHIQYRNSADGIIGGRNVNGQIYTGSTAPLTTSTGGATTATSGTGTVATVTTTSNHNLSTGDRVTVAGVTPTGYNGTYIVTGTPTTTSFTYNNTTTGSQTVAGTVAIDAQASIVSRSAATTPLILRAAVNQGVNMFRIEGSGGSATATIDAAGAASFVGGGVVITGGSSVSVNGTLNTATNLRVGDVNATISGNKIIYLSNATVPSVAAIGGGFLFANSGALQYRGTSGSNATILNADGTNPLLSSNNTFSGVQTINNAVNIGSGSTGAVGLEIGSTNGTGATTPFIDFHSGATAIDFDSRIIASGGNGTNGQGTLTYTAATNTFTGSVNTAFGLGLTGATSPLSLNGSAGTTGQVLTSAGSGTTPTWSSAYISTSSSYFAGHNPEGRLMYNTYLTNDMANARLRGSAVSATQNGSPYSISNANWDAMFDGTATFFNISPTSGFTFPLVITVPLPRTLTYGTWVGLSFGSTSFRANSVTIEVFSLDSSSWVTVFTTTSNTSEDIFASVSGLVNGNATGINQVRYTISNPNSTQLRLQHLWAYNFNSDMWSQTMMPRSGGAIYGAITVPDRITLRAVANAANQSNGLLLSNTVDAWQSGVYLRTDGSGNPRLSLLAPTGGLGESVSIDAAAKVGIGNTAPVAQLDVYSQLSTRIGQVIRGASGQSVNLQEWQSNTPTTLASVSQTGRGTFDTLNAPNGAFFGNITSQPGNGAYLAVQGYAAGHRPLLVRGFGATTANLVDYQNGSGVVVGGRNGVGQIFTGSANPLAFTVGGATTATSGDGTTATITTTTAHGLAVGDIVTVAGITPTGYNGAFSVASTPTTTSFTYANTTTGAQTVAGTVSVAPQASITARSAGTRGLIVRGASGQSVNIFEVQDSGSTLRARIAQTGMLEVQPSSGDTANFRNAAGGLTLWGGNSSWFMNAPLYMTGGSWSQGRLGIDTSGVGNVGIVVRAVASQVEDMVEIQSSSGAVLAGDNAVGQIFTGGSTPILTATGGTIQSIATGANPLITMASAHGLTTGDIVVLAGTTGGTYNGTFVVASTPLTTTFTITSALTAGQAGAAGTVSDPAQASITARSPGTTGLIVRAAASQSADIQQWQISDGTIRSRVDSGGNFKSVNVATLNSFGQMAESNSGALFVMGRATAQASSPGLNTGTLYFRDGTTAGTLRLATRTGASGVEETIIDNLSSTGSTAGAQFVGAGGVNTSGAVTTGAALNLNYASPTIASNNASAASIFTSTVTGVTMGSSTIRTTAFPADGTTATATAGAGYMGLPQNSTTTGAYTIVAADAGRHIYASATRTVTINSNANLALPIGTTITFIAGTGATMTIAITSDTLILAGPGTTGSRTLAPFGMATAVKITSTSWIISGNGLT